MLLLNFLNIGQNPRRPKNAPVILMNCSFHLIDELRQPVISFDSQASYVKYKLYRIDSNAHVLVGWAMGENGETISITDTSAPSGEQSYYILPEHNDAYRHGAALTGKISQIIKITVP